MTECEGMCPVVDRLTQELSTTETRVRQECAEMLKKEIGKIASYDSNRNWMGSITEEASNRIRGLEAGIAAIIHPHPAQGAVCEWDYDHEDRWDTSCGTSWLFIDGGPAENGVKYCHGCGLPIKVKEG